MKLILAGTKVVTTGITSPSQLGRGEIAFFTSDGVLVAPTTTIANRNTISSYEGLGNGLFKQGAILTKGSIGYISADYKAATKGTLEYVEIVPSHFGDCMITVYTADAYLNNGHPRAYTIVVTRDRDITIEAFFDEVKRKLDALVKKLRVMFPSATFTYTSEIVPTAADGKPIHFKFAFKQVEMDTIQGVGIVNFTYNAVNALPTSPVGAGTDIAKLEKEGAVYRGHNPQLREDEGRLNDRYFTANPDVNYKQFILSSKSEGIQETLSTEDSDGYLVEMIVALDASNAANLTAADTLFKTL